MRYYRELKGILAQINDESFENGMLSLRALLASLNDPQQQAELIIDAMRVGNFDISHLQAHMNPHARSDASDNAEAPLLPQSLSTQAIFHAQSRPPADTSDSVTHCSWRNVAILTQVLAAPLGSLTGTQLGRVGTVFGFGEMSKAVKGLLSTMGWIMQMTLFLAQGPPQKMPEYHSRFCRYFHMFLATAFGYAIAWPSAVLTKESAAPILESILPDSTSPGTLALLNSAAFYSNLHLNGMMGLSVIEEIAFLIPTLWRANEGKRLYAVLLGLALLVIEGLSDGMPFIVSGTKISWLETWKDNPSVLYTASVLLNAINLLVVALPLVTSLPHRVFSDDQRHCLEKVFSMLMGLTGGGLFATLTYETYESEDFPGGAYAAVAAFIIGLWSMADFGAGVARRIRTFFRKRRSRGGSSLQVNE